jgi:hypothetical protein
MSTAAEAVIEQPKTEHQSLTLGGDSFETKVSERKAAAEKPPAPPEKVEPPPKQVEPPDKTEKAAPEKVEKAVPAKAPSKTPLDLTPPEKKAEPVVAADAEIDELLKSEPPANASASSKANHAAMRKGLEHANARIKELAGQVEKAKTVAVPADVQERLTAAETAVKERDALIERVAFQQSPRFQKFVTEGEAELTAAKSYLEGSEINPNVIDVAAHTKGAKRIALLTESGMEPNVVSAVLSNLTRADAINRDRDAAQENWKTTQSDWNAEQTKAQEAKAATAKSNEDKVFTEVGKKVAEDLAPFTTTKGENPEWDAGVDARFKEAQEYFDGKKPLQDTSRLIYEGLAGRVYKDAFEDLRTKYNELVAETGRIKAARPGAASGKTDTTPAASTGNPMKDAANTFNEMRAKRGL